MFSLKLRRIHIPILLRLILLEVLFLRADGLLAQPTPVQQIQNSRFNQQTAIPLSMLSSNTVPEMYEGEDSDVGPQRILRMTPRHRYFNVLLDSQMFYSDNANYGPTGQKISSTIFINTFQATINPRNIALGPGNLSTCVGFASQWYNYENSAMSPFDFNAQTAFVGGKYAFGKWLVSVDGSGTRLVNQRDDYGLTYQELMPALTVQRFFPISKSLLLSIGNQVDYHFTDDPTTFATYTEINNRLDDITSVTLTWQITSRLVFQPSYRFMFTNYRYDTLGNSDRNDFLHSLGCSLAYYFNENFSLRTFFNYNVNFSDDPNAVDYHETNGGVGVSVNLLF